MTRLPTDRTGWLALLAATTNLAVNGTMLSLILINKPAIVGLVWRDLVAAHLPSVFVLVAAMLGGRSHVRHRWLIVAAASVALVGELCFLDAWLGGPAASVVGSKPIHGVQVLVAVPPRSYLIAAIAFVPVVVAWWRPTHRTDTENEG